MSESQYAVRPNKTQLKREIRVLNDLGKQLIALPAGSLAKMPITEKMRDAIKDAQRFSRGALQRQLRRIGNLMQLEDVPAIELELKKLLQPTKQQTLELHQLEQWRDRLIVGDDKLLNELFEKFEDVDGQYLRQTIRNAQKEKKLEKAPKSARLLFKYLSQLMAQFKSAQAKAEQIKLDKQEQEENDNHSVESEE